MKRFGLIVVLLVLLTACQETENQRVDNEINDTTNNSQNNEIEGGYDVNDESIDESRLREVTTYTFDDDQLFISVEEFVSEVDGNYEYDEINKTLEMSIVDRDFYLVKEVPVLQINGEQVASDEIYIIEDDEQAPYITKAFIDYGLEMDYTINDEDSQLVLKWEDSVVEAWSPTDETKVELESFSVEEMIEYLSFLEKPIEGASVSTVESHLPGAPRDYRNGYHEGIDWYEDVSTDTPIQAMGEGIVVRVDNDFEDYDSHDERDADRDRAAEVGFTPEYILDRLRGKQVWVEYENGVLNRFAHLDSIPEGLEVGQQVESDTIIGYAGNTGTSGALNQDGSGIHLHQDLLIYGELFWENFSLDETQIILNELWD